MVLFLLSVICVGGSVCHSITSVEAPRWPDPRAPAALRCRYSRLPSDPPLHSVKWYRDRHEIFRYTPQDYITQAFNNTEVSVVNSSCDTSSCTIFVRPEPGAARYTCEVSSEGPRFAVDRKSSDMTLAILPEYDPLITGLPTVVQFGEEVVVNCTSDYSLPAAVIEWFIDDVHQEDPMMVSPTHASEADGDDLRASWRSLRVQGGGGGGGGGREHLSLRCQAVVLTHPVHVRSMAVRLRVVRRPSLSKYTHNSSRASPRRVQWSAAVWTFIALLTTKVPSVK